LTELIRVLHGWLWPEGWWSHSGWKRLSGCCGELWVVEISSGAVIACSSEWCVYVVNKSNIQSIPHP
jgi:hypothetical protein